MFFRSHIPGTAKKLVVQTKRKSNCRFYDLCSTHSLYNRHIVHVFLRIDVTFFNKAFLNLFLRHLFSSNRVIYSPRPGGNE